MPTPVDNNQKYIHGLNLSEYLGINDQFLRPLQNHLELHIYIYSLYIVNIFCMFIYMICILTLYMLLFLHHSSLKK